MSRLIITLLPSYTDQPREEELPKKGPVMKPRDGVDSKVQGFARSKISSGEGSLFASTSPPKVPLVSDVLLQSSDEDLLKSKKTKVKKRPLVHRGLEWDEDPIGLMPCDPDSWINAVMQLVLRLPFLRTILSISAPRSYDPFRIFLDHYYEDREDGLAVSSADGRALVECLKKNLMPHLFGPFGKVNLFGIFQGIFFSGYPFGLHSLDTDQNRTELWQCEWDADQISLLDQIRNKALVTHAPADLLVSVKKKNKNDFCSVIPRQIFYSDLSSYYDLQGFIEKRQDGEHFDSIAYVKIRGKNWVQCRNERILKLSSTNLDYPLLSSKLLHYKKCSTLRR